MRVDASTTHVTIDFAVRDARRDEFGGVSRLLEEVYGEFQPHFPDDLWPAYLGEIVDIRSRLGSSELIVAELAGRHVGTVGFYPAASRSTLERWPLGWASIRTLAVRSDARGRDVGEALARLEED